LVVKLNVKTFFLVIHCQEYQSNAGANHGNSFHHFKLVLKVTRLQQLNAQPALQSTLVHIKTALKFLTLMAWRNMVSIYSSKTKLLTLHALPKLSVQTHFLEFKNNASVIDMAIITSPNTTRTNLCGSKRKRKKLKRRLPECKLKT